MTATLEEFDGGKEVRYVWYGHSTLSHWAPGHFFSANEITEEGKREQEEGSASLLPRHTNR